MAQCDLYWRRTRRITLFLLIIWIGATFGLIWFARELNQFSLFGFPLGFYGAAQGVLLVYLGIIWLYNRWMRKLDAEFGVDSE